MYGIRRGKTRKPQDEESFLRFPFLFYLTGNSENIFLKSFTENIRGTRKIILYIKSKDLKNTSKSLFNLSKNLF